MMSRQIIGSGMIILGALGLLLAVFLVRRVYRKKQYEMYMPVVSMAGAGLFIIYSGLRLLMA